MKKYILIVVIGFIFMTGCSSLVLEDPFNKISIEELENKIDSKDTFVFTACSMDSSLCDNFIEDALMTLKRDYNIEIDFLDLEIESADFINSFEDLKSEYLGSALDENPATLFIVDGEIESIIYSNVPAETIYDEYSKFFN